MTEKSSHLVLEPFNDGFRLRAKNINGEIQEILLDDISVLILAQLAPQPRQQILAKRSPGPSVQAGFSTKVSRAAVHWNKLGEAILLTLDSPSGGQTTFDFQPLAAKRLATMILETFSQMDSSTTPLQ
jgi:hypothetical protein